MFNSPTVCPTCPARFDMVNCIKQVQIGDGLSNWLYAGYTLGGSNFCSIIKMIMSYTICLFIPGCNSYFNQQCSNFASPSNTYQDQLNFCFWLTLPSMLLPFMILIIVSTFFVFIIPSLFDLVVAVLYVFIYFLLGVFSVFKTTTQPERPEDEDDDEEQEEQQQQQKPKGDSALMTGISITSRLFAGIVNLSQVKKKEIKQD
jgi:hypothetical protein